MTIQLGFTSVLGYYSPADIEAVKDSTFKYFLIFHNVINVGAALLSPLAGVIRAITAGVTYHFYTKRTTPDDPDVMKNRKFFLLAEMAKGGLEFLGAGPLFGIVDCVVTLNRYELLCFAKPIA